MAAGASGALCATPDADHYSEPCLRDATIALMRDQAGPGTGFGGCAGAPTGLIASWLSKVPQSACPWPFAPADFQQDEFVGCRPVGAQPGVANGCSMRLYTSRLGAHNGGSDDHTDMATAVTTNKIGIDQSDYYDAVAKYIVINDLAPECRRGFGAFKGTFEVVPAAP